MSYSLDSESALIRCEVVIGGRNISRLRSQVTSLQSYIGDSAGERSSTIDYFLALSCAMQRTPMVSTVWRGGELLGVVFGTQGTLFGCALGVVYLGTGDDDRFLLARDRDRALVLESAIRKFLRRGLVHTIIAYCGESAPLDVSCFARTVPGCSCELDITFARSTLVLDDSYEHFLMSLTKPTRRTVRRYRRKAADCQWRFEASLAPAELDCALQYMVHHQRTSRHSLRTLSTLCRMLTALGSPVLCGVFDKDNQPISVAMGWFENTNAYLLIQLNHGDASYDRANVSTVMRSHLIEELVARGVKRLTMVGSCMGRFQPSCLAVPCRLITLKKPGLMSNLYWHSHKLRFLDNGIGEKVIEPER